MSGSGQPAPSRCQWEWQNQHRWRRPALQHRQQGWEPGCIRIWSTKTNGNSKAHAQGAPPSSSSTTTTSHGWQRRMHDWGCSTSAVDPSFTMPSSSPQQMADHGHTSCLPTKPLKGSGMRPIPPTYPRPTPYPHLGPSAPQPLPHLWGPRLQC